jgi:peroxiredoxin
MFLRRLAVLALCVTALAAATIPRQSPEFAIQTMDGKQILLSQYKGKVVVLAFILTYCPHCQKTCGILGQMQKEYGPQGLQILASAIEDMAKMTVPDFIKKFQPPFPVGYDLRDNVYTYLQHPSMLQMMMPNLAFIDRQGVIRSQYAGDDKFINSDDQEKNIRGEIEKLLKPAAGATSTARKKSAASQASK